MKGLIKKSIMLNAHKTLPNGFFSLLPPLSGFFYQAIVHETLSFHIKRGKGELFIHRALLITNF